MTGDEDGQGGEPTGELVAGPPRTLTPEAAFKTVGNETRLAILDTLWGPAKPGRMAFADLRKAVGMRDGSQFNFHLKKLVEGGFIEKADGAYALRQAGARVICTIRTGYLTDHPELEPFETTGQCYSCAAPLRARYVNEMFFIDCTACDRLHSRGWFPPNGLDARTREEALTAFDRTMRALRDLARAGICPVCNGLVEPALSRTLAEVPIRSYHLDAERDGGVRLWYVCGYCSAWVTASPGDAVLDHPAVVELYRNHGIDIRDCAHWELPWTVDPSAAEIVTEEPFRVRLTVTLDDERRVLTLDESFEVQAVEHGSWT